jgi:hypothetical protein
MQPPVRVQAQIAAFAHERELFPDEAAFTASQQGETKFAPNFFIPSELFNGEGEAQPYSMFAGTVLCYEKVVNPAYDVPFHHFEVRAQGGVFDVVAEEELVQTQPVIGGILRGSFWMSGRVV